MQLLHPRDKSTVFGGGILALEGPAQFPTTPDGIVFKKYLLPMTYGRGEAEEAAARLISICQDWGSWVAVDFNVFMRHAANEFADKQIQSGQVYSLMRVEMLRLGTSLSEWIKNVVSVGLNDLCEKDFIEVRRIIQDGEASDVMIITPKFFEPIARYMVVSA